jgi:hypothetical protein
LRALFKVYLDMSAFEHVRLKIFLRTDIWRRITDQGFREASHITRSLTIQWDRRSLLNLVVRRAIQNAAISRSYDTTESAVLASGQAQEEFFYKMCPRQVEIGPNKSQTFDWMLGRTKDGTGQTAPRELIHLLNSLRDVQMQRLEAGDPNPEGVELFSRGSFKEALVPVSRVRLEQTLFAEYPTLKVPLTQLKEEKTLQTIHSLAQIWIVSHAEAIALANQLVAVGFFEQRGPKSAPEYWVPFLYRDALDMVQGTAD